MADYACASGDVAFLREHWDNVKRAYLFTRSHTGQDGVYDNKEGTGWVESWKPRMPDQEIYLAALDEQSAESISYLAKLMNDDQLAAAAQAQANLVRERLRAYRQPDGFYAFSKNADGSYDPPATIFPSVAWWTGSLALPEANSMLSRWASHEFFSDWGLRSLSDQSPLFDPLSYHQGTVWPLFTGWVSVAEYRSGHPLAGYLQLMSNVNLTWAHDPGGITELLSGKFDEPLGRSSSRQTWSSAMVISATLRGMFGLQVDAGRQCLEMSPDLPATWNEVQLHHLHLGTDQIEVKMHRSKGEMVIEAASQQKKPFCLCTQLPNQADCSSARAISHSTTIRLRPVELEVKAEAPMPGSQTQQLKVLEESYSENSLALSFEAPGGTIQEMPIRINSSRKLNLRVTGASLLGTILRIVFQKGTGYQKQSVQIEW